MCIDFLTAECFKETRICNPRAAISCQPPPEVLILTPQRVEEWTGESFPRKLK